MLRTLRRANRAPRPANRMLRRAAVVATVGLVALSPTAAYGHGIGGRADLPVPVSFFAIGASVVIVITFVMLSASWTEPRLQEPKTEAVRRPAWLRWVVIALRIMGLAGLVTVVVAGFLDGQGSALNIAPVLVFVNFWLIVPFVGAVIGDWWRWLNPWATLSKWMNRGRPERAELVTRWGVWPAAVLFVAFTWFELVSPDNGNPLSIAVAALAYTLIVLAGGYVAGPHTGLRLFEAFHTYNGLLADIAPFDLDPDAGSDPNQRATAPGIAWRGWLRGLPQVPEWPGLVAFVVAMIGTVTYDGLSGTEWWAELFPELRREVWFGTAALIGTVLGIGALYGLASKLAAELAGDHWTARRVAVRFAHTLVPIALAYAVAHYLTLVLFEGQLIFPAISDPFGQGWDLFGTAAWEVSFFLSPEAVWYLQLVAIVGGHVAGVVLAHDRALADFGGEVAVRTQYAMLALMVALTSLGLFILAG